MTIVCPECKNDISLETENVKKGYYFECQTCGITLEIRDVKDDGTPEVEIVEEEK